MTILTYKGYQASADYEDGQIVIQLLHIDDFISTICHDAREVEREFHKLVDEYLETCRQLGREPKKPYKGSLNIRMRPELHRRTAMAASLAKVSLNAWIVTACQEKLASREEGGTDYQVLASPAISAGFDTQILSGNLAGAHILSAAHVLIGEPGSAAQPVSPSGGSTTFNLTAERIDPGTGRVSIIGWVVDHTGAAIRGHRWPETTISDLFKKETT
jgi:predicted HicB family RNase H-like nuclease